MNDICALAALRAFEEAGAVEQCAVMGQNALRAARAELRRPGTRLVGSVAYFPERYGDELIPLALNILRQKPVPQPSSSNINSSLRVTLISSTPSTSNLPPPFHPGGAEPSSRQTRNFNSAKRNQPRTLLRPYEPTRRSRNVQLRFRNRPNP